jgi:murein DD-endopeptidase MepM/ murein hydrolase activator NlpD
VGLRTTADRRDRGERTSRVPLSGRFRSVLKGIRNALRRVVRSGKQRFTIMFIPHSEKRVLNLQVNTFAIVFVATLAVAIVAGFFYLATAFSGSERIAVESGTRLEAAEANLDEVRQEVRTLLQVYDEFEATLSSTLGRLDIASGVDGDMPTTGGDLATMLDLEEVGDDDMREILDLQRAIASLRAAIGPLNAVSEVLDLHRQLLSDIPNFWPVQNGLGWVTMEFGPNIHPIYGMWYMHKGIDIAARVGTPIVAAANGVVTERGFDPNGYGGYVEIDHNYGFRTKYGHLGTISDTIQEGQEVVQGQRLGTMGSTGLSTGPHLDFQIWIGTENIDPAFFLKLSKPDFNTRRLIRQY